MSIMNGCMFQFSNRDKNLLAFMSLNSDQQPCRNAVVLIAGVTDGFLSMNCTPFLAESLLNLDYSLVQVNLSSSFLQFGFGSLKTDSEELTELVRAIKKTYQFKKIIFMGHSTGCQDTLYFLRHSDISSEVNAVILHAAVSDRDYIVTLPETSTMLQEANALVQNKQDEMILKHRYFGAPMTASRFLSLAERLGDDDMFSLDLTEDELEPILSAVKVPITLCFSAHDQYVDIERQKVFADKLVKMLKKTSPIVECEYFAGDHDLTEKQHYEKFVEYVCKFVASL